MPCAAQRGAAKQRRDAPADDTPERGQRAGRQHDRAVEHEIVHEQQGADHGHRNKRKAGQREPVREVAITPLQRSLVAGERVIARPDRPQGANVTRTRHTRRSRSRALASDDASFRVRSASRRYRLSRRRTSAMGGAGRAWDTEAGDSGTDRRLMSHRPCSTWSALRLQRPPSVTARLLRARDVRDSAPAPAIAVVPARALPGASESSNAGRWDRRRLLPPGVRSKI